MSSASPPDPVTNAAHKTGNVRDLWIVASIVFLVPFCFALFTNHVWEDYYITFRASKNLAEGHGLVFQIGERVHSFTSPLGVLLPAILSFITHSDTATLWVFRGISCAALALAAVILWRTFEEQGIPKTARWLVTFALLADSKTIDFAINGMETSFMVLFAVWLLHLLVQSQPPRSITLGLVFAGLMWTRPDAFVVAIAIILAALSFTIRSKQQLVATILLLIKAGMWAALVYGPWLIWATWYYGSPVPHTILAKSASSPRVLGAGYLLMSPLDYLTGSRAMESLLNPSYYFLGGWPAVTIKLSFVLSVIAGFFWLAPTVPRIFRISSLALFAGSFYLQAIPPAPWYFPVWQMLAAITLGGAGATWIGANKDRRIQGPLARATVTILLIVQLSSVGLAAVQFRNQQTIIEDGGRRLIGEWLARNAAPSDTVFLEPLGYVGFFSQLHMLDYPGLSAPSVVAVAKKVGTNFGKIVETLQPTWLVLRPHETYSYGFKETGVLENYELLQTWDAREKLNAIDFLPGRGLLELDAVFRVYHRKPSARSNP